MICGILLLLLFILYRPGRRNKVHGMPDGSSEQSPEPAVPQGECCGKHLVCEKRRLADAMTHDAIYYEDEELDVFKGHPSDGYSDDEIESFRYVMDTMRQDEVRGWLESLQVRGIELPDELKDEAWMMIGE